MIGLYLLLLWVISVECDVVPKQQRFFDVDRSGLRQYWELISWQGLIKAKVKTILPEIPHIERVLYEICARESNDLVGLAKCAVTVIDKREQIRVETSTLSFIKRKRFQKKRRKFVAAPMKKIRSHPRPSKEYIADRKRRIRLKKLLDQMTREIAPEMKIRRIVRSADGPTPYIDALNSLKEHFRKQEIVRSYYDLVERENKRQTGGTGQILLFRLYRKLKLPISSRKEKASDGFEESMQEVLQAINSYTGSNDTVLSMLSPRLFSIVPGASSGSLLSPDILSFYDDGLVSVPRLIQIITGNSISQKGLLEWVLKVSGAGEQLMRILNDKQQEIVDTAVVSYPLVQRMSRNDYNWLLAKRSFTKEQHEDVERNGFTYMTAKQQELVFKDRGLLFNTTHLTRRDKELWLENKIRGLSELTVPSEEMHRRVKRQEGTADEGFTTLVPFAFGNMVEEGVALELVTLSPQAFVSSTFGPEALAVYTLSPHAFVAAILSPVALVARVLSPGAFILEVLSPRAFTPYILNPRVFLVEVLTPRAFEPHIGSPDVMVLDILSPAGLSPQVLSPEMGAIIILSPKFLSPRMASAEKFLVEILSPHILGGPHTSHDETVISIGGGEHSHDHKPGDEGTAAHQEDIHVHEGPLEGDHAHEEQEGYNPFGFTLVPTIPPKDDYFQLNDLINPTIPPDGDVLGFKYLTPSPHASPHDPLGLQAITVPPILRGRKKK